MGAAAAIPTIIAGAAPIVGGLIGQGQASGERDRQRNLQQQAMDAWNNISLPDIEKQKLMYELPYLVGELSPLQEQAEALGQSRMEGIEISPELRAQQMQGLQALAEVGEAGLTPAERVELDQIRRSVAQEQQARDASILQNLQERGMGGSGLELIQRLKSSQMGADRASQESQKVGAEAAARRLQALQALGTQAGQVRGQEFSEQSDVAQAADAINRFNLQTRGDVQQRNIASQNIAQQQNLANKQNVQQQQVQLKNLQQEKNKQLQQQEFENALRRASGQSGSATTASQQAGESAANIGKQWSEIGSGVGGLIGSTFGGKK